MSDEEIIAIARQVGYNNFIAFARLIAAKQIEIDAGICDGMNEHYGITFEVVAACAGAIRGQTK
jgi:hypothetical protein